MCTPNTRRRPTLKSRSSSRRSTTSPTRYSTSSSTRFTSDPSEAGIGGRGSVLGVPHVAAVALYLVSFYPPDDKEAGGDGPLSDGLVKTCLSFSCHVLRLFFNGEGGRKGGGVGGAESNMEFVVPYLFCFGGRSPRFLIAGTCCAPPLLACMRTPQSPPSAYACCSVIYYLRGIPGMSKYTSCLHYSVRDWCAGERAKASGGGGGVGGGGDGGGGGGGGGGGSNSGSSNVCLQSGRSRFPSCQSRRTM